MLRVKRVFFIGFLILATGITSVWLLSRTTKIPFLTNDSKDLVDEVWQIIDQTYVDSTFNQVNWKAVRVHYMRRHYASRSEAYTAIREMLKKLNNPHTKFLDPEEFENMKVDTSGELTGVGIQLKVDDETKKLRVIELRESSPALSAGILVNDVLTHIDGKPTEGMTADRAVTLIRGQLNTQVSLTVQRGDKSLEYKLNRTRIEIHPVRFSQRDSSGNIGYIRLEQFSADAPQEMRAAIEKMEKQNVKGYILDLRSNPGGLLYVSIDIARMWLKEGSIVSTVDRQGEQDRERANNRALTDKPLVVLVNGDSASASEILAGALQDNKRAVLVGTKTLGKGLVETVRELSDKQLGIAVSTAKLLRPNGVTIDKNGIRPDVEIKLTKNQEALLLNDREKIGTSTDLQFMKAMEVFNRQIKVVGTSGIESTASDLCQIKDSLGVPNDNVERIAKECLERFLMQQGNSWFTWHLYEDIWRLEQWNSDAGIEIKSSDLTRADELNGVKWKGSGELKITARRIKNHQEWDKWYVPEQPEDKISMTLEYIEGVWNVKLGMEGSYEKPKDSDINN